MGRTAKRTGSWVRVIVVASVLAIIAVSSSAGLARVQIGDGIYVVHADLHLGKTHFKMDAQESFPYGVASINGKRLQLNCVYANGQLAITYLLIPYLQSGWVVLKGTLPDGAVRYITLWDPVLGKPKMNIRTTRGDQGICGASFDGLAKAKGRLVITPI